MTRPFSTVSVIGLGTVGSAVAESLARSGLRVVAVETDDAALVRGRARIDELLATTPDGEAAGADRITYTTRAGDVADADLVIEAVPERLETKCEVLRKANAVCAPSAVFATTTTALSVARIAAASGRMPRTVGLHLINPAASRVVELAGTPVTEPTVRRDVTELVRHLGRTPVAVGDRPGFIAGALTMGLLNSAVAMYEQRYATCENIDTAMMLGCGLPMGPLAQLDMIGLDVAYDMLRALHERSGDRRYAPAPLLAGMVTAGTLGRKTGRGFHTYESTGHGDRAPAAGGSPVVRPTVDRSRPVRQVGVVGSGTMATGIAEVCARAGYTTVLVARTEGRAKDALATVELSLNRARKRGRLTPDAVGESVARLTGVAQLEGLDGCDLVIEAVVEDLEVKRGRFRDLDTVCRPGVVFATTTSSLSVTECAAATSRPQDVIGLHFFNPASVMKLVELVRTAVTSEDVIGTAHAFCSTLGKRAVDCTDRTGFIVNSLLFPYLNHAVTMLEDNYAAAADIDVVMTEGLGYPMGPFQLLDVVGLDVSLAIQNELHQAFSAPGLAPAQVLEDLVLAGHVGRKTGQGFHTHRERE